MLFFAYVNYISDLNFQDNITFSYNITNKTRNLRYLEEIYCPNITNSTTQKLRKYNCSIPDIQSDISKLEVKLEESEMGSTEYANIQSKNIQNQKGNILEVLGEDILTINNAELLNESNTFIIKGRNETPFDDSEITLNVINKDNNIEIQGKIKYNSTEEKAEIKLNPKRTISTSFDGAIGVFPKKTNEAKYKGLYLKFLDIANSFLEYKPKTSIYQMGKKSGGLSGGAIVGIILPCIVVLLGATAAAYFFGKKNPDLPSPVQNMNSTVGVNSSTNVVN